MNTYPNQTTVAALGRNWEMVKLAVEGVDEGTLNARPNDNSNSMSWLIWHMTRVTDRFIHYRLADKPHIWTVDAWHEKFGMDPDPQDFGMGWSNEQVAAWQPPPKDVLMDYFEAVNTTAAKYLSSMTDADLGREITMTNPTMTLSARESLGILVWDSIVHGGQVAYLRGFYRGGGWHR